MKGELDPLPIEVSCAANFSIKLTDANVVNSIFGGAVSSTWYKNNVKFQYYRADFHLQFMAIEKGVRVSLEISLNDRKKNLEGDVFFGEGHKEGELNDGDVREILEDYVIKGLKDVYKESYSNSK